MVCIIDGCDRQVHARGLCHKHYQQDMYCGGVKKTKFDPNEFIFDGDICRIVLRDNQGNKKGEAIIDIEDHTKVKDVKWGLLNNGYVHSRFGLLHRFVNDTPREMDTDHINLNKLDNRKSNLRSCTKTQNSMNIGIMSSNQSGFKGVCWDKEQQKWIAYISLNKQQVVLGRFRNKIEAAIKYNETAIEHYGEFARLNEV